MSVLTTGIVPMENDYTFQIAAPTIMSLFQVYQSRDRGQ